MPAAVSLMVMVPISLPTPVASMRLTETLIGLGPFSARAGATLTKRETATNATSFIMGGMIMPVPARCEQVFAQARQRRSPHEPRHKKHVLRPRRGGPGLREFCRGARPDARATGNHLFRVARGLRQPVRAA